MKKIVALLLALLLPLLAAGCTTEEQATASTQAKPQPLKKTVGICLPDDGHARWTQCADALTAGLQQKNCQAQVVYADNDAQIQAAQVADLIAEPVGCLVIAAVDPMALTDVLRQAKAAAIPVIALDRLLTLTDGVNAYVGFDHAQIGLSIANRLIQAKKLDTAQAENRSYTIEFFMGAPEDPGAYLLHRTLLQTLQPYLETGVLVCRSGRTAFEDVCTLTGSEFLARSALEHYLAEFYTDAVPDIVCTASDEIADALCEALAAVEGVTEENWPVLCGQNATPEAIKRIRSGKQSFTIYGDLSGQARHCLTVVQILLDGASFEETADTCHNGMISVPAFFAESTLVDAENYRAVLLDTGIYTESQLTE